MAGKEFLGPSDVLRGLNPKKFDNGNKFNVKLKNCPVFYNFLTFLENPLKAKILQPNFKTAK